MYELFFAIFKRKIQADIVYIQVLVKLLEYHEKVDLFQ